MEKLNELMNLVCDNDLDRVKEKLQDQSLDINQIIRNDYNPLHLAARFGFTEIVPELLKYPGIDLNKGVGYGNFTAFGLAINFGHLDIDSPG